MSHSKSWLIAGLLMSLALLNFSDGICPRRGRTWGWWPGAAEVGAAAVVAVIAVAADIAAGRRWAQL